MGKPGEREGGGALERSPWILGAQLSPLWGQEKEGRVRGLLSAWTYLLGGAVSVTGPSAQSGFGLNKRAVHFLSKPGAGVAVPPYLCLTFFLLLLHC